MIRSQRRRRLAGKKSQKKLRKTNARKPLSEVLEERQLLASDLASSVCSSGVLSGTCTETESFSGVPDLSDAAIFDQFDPSVGTLTGVRGTRGRNLLRLLGCGLAAAVIATGMVSYALFGQITGAFRLAEIKAGLRRNR